MSNNIIRSSNNFNAFKSHVMKYGLSLSNFYDVQFQLNANASGNFLNNLLNTVIHSDQNATSVVTMQEFMRIYADECSIPGFSISTGDYRITNSPNMKYAYGIVNNEFTVSFILDADSQTRRLFDAWGNFIYSGVSYKESTLVNSALNQNTNIQLGRTRYRDEYVCDIIVIKLERYASSNKNLLPPPTDESDDILTSRFFKQRDIIPGSNKPGYSRFGKPIPKYSVRLKNAFPTLVSAIPLSSGSSQLIKVQATFEYEMAIPSTQTGGSVEEQDKWDWITG